MTRPYTATDVLALVDRSGGPDACHPWAGNITDQGYGRVGYQGKRHPAHRLVYVLTGGVIPDGLDLDHTCHNRDLSCAGGSMCLHRRCCNTTHHEPVPGSVNRQRGRGPALAAERWTAHMQAAGTAAAALKAQSRTHCRAGHQYTELNTRINRNGSRQCRICAAENLRNYRRDNPDKFARYEQRRDRVKRSEAERLRYHAKKLAA